jgi:hypothetical protein
MKTVKSGVAIAAAAAALFAVGTAAPVASAADNAGVKCAGVNSCKGKSECASAKNGCAGQNACKGQGWVNKPSAEACKKEGGTIAKG